jgi:hypothetical protein
MNNTSNPPPHAEASPDPEAPMDSCSPAPKIPLPRRSRPAHIPSDNHPCGGRPPLPSHQPKSQKHGTKSKKPLPPSEPSTPPSASESGKVGGSVRSRRSGRPRPRRTQGFPLPSPSTEKPTPPDESAMTNLEKASNQMPSKKKHLPKQDDEDEWKLEPELPDDMRLWGTFSDNLAIFPKRDNKLKKSRFIRKDAVFRMLRFLISRTNNLDSASNPSYCCNCREVVLSIKEEIVKKYKDPPSSKKPVSLPEEDPISGTESPPHFFESDYPSCPYSALGPGKSVCPCISDSLLDGILPEDAVLNPHHPAHQDHPAKTLPPNEPGSNSSPPEPHVERGAPTNGGLSPSLSFPEKNDIANLSEENDIAHSPTFSWNDSGDVALEASF